MYTLPISRKVANFGYLFLLLILLLSNSVVITRADAQEENHTRDIIQPEVISSSQIIDHPTFSWNTFLGTNFDDSGYAIAADSDNNIYVTGGSERPWGTPIREFTEDEVLIPDAYVAKFNSNGNLLWNTFLGGAWADEGYGITTDKDGFVYVVGLSALYWGDPVRYVPGFSSYSDAFVAKLNPNGELVWNTFLGGYGYDYGYGIAVNDIGEVYVTGNSTVTWELPMGNNGRMSRVV